jgi:apolipoprotein N-acyltransferase
MRALAAVLGGVMFAASFPPVNLTWLGWLALAPLLLAVRETRVRQAALLGALFALSAVLLLVSWVPGALVSGFGASWLGAVGVWVALGLSSVPASAAYGALVSRVDPRALGYVPTVALVWSLVELSWELWFPRLPWVSLGASQIDTPIASIASLVGVHGVSAVLASVSALLVQISMRPSVLVPAMSAMVLVAFAGWSLWPTSDSGPHEDSARVAVVQPGLPMSERRDGSFERRMIEILLEESEKTEAAEILVWPENSFLSTPRGAVLESVQAFVDRRDVLLISGGRQRTAEGWRTVVMLFAPGESMRVVYVKRRLLPLAEAVPRWLPPMFRRSLGRLAPSLPMQPGSLPSTQLIGPHEVDLSVCYEATFQSDSADGSAALAVNLVNDGWYDRSAGAGQHLLLARWRAIESAQTLIRSASTGISAIVAPDGSIRARLDVGTRGALGRSVPSVSRRSVFERYGRVSLTLASVLLLVSAVISIRRKR